jgi:hypothetical protein
MVMVSLSLLKIKNLVLITFLFLYHSVINAKSFDFGIGQINGTSSYEVDAIDLGLRSKLVFPYTFNTFNISFSGNYLSGKVNIGASLPLSNKKEIASDYDWRQDQLTVVSNSDSRMNKYFNVHAEWNKKILNRFGFVTKIYYQELDTIWNNTRQYDYVRDILTFSNENTLEFEQNYFMYDAGFTYLAWKSKSINFLIEGKYTTGLVKLKDNHLLRDFYTLQDSKISGRSVGMKLEYTLGSSDKVFIEVIKKNISDDQTKMDYYTKNDFKFASYKSKYHETRNTILFTFEKYM